MNSGWSVRPTGAHACSQMQVTLAPKTSKATLPPVRVQSSIKPGVQTSELMSSGLHVQVSWQPGQKILHWHVRPLGSGRVVPQVPKAGGARQTVSRYGDLG